MLICIHQHLFYCVAFLYADCNPDLDCCSMAVPRYFVHKEAIMTVDTSENNLTYRWWKGKDDIKVIDRNTKGFTLEDGNKVNTHFCWCCTVLLEFLIYKINPVNQV